MDIEDIIKKVVSNLSQIFTSRVSSPDTVLAASGLGELSNHFQLQKFLITPTMITNFCPANDDYAPTKQTTGDLYLSVQDIENLGGQLIIHKHQANSVNIEDNGWMAVKNEDLNFIDNVNYETYRHESGAILQVAPGMTTKFCDNSE